MKLAAALTAFLLTNSNAFAPSFQHVKRTNSNVAQHGDVSTGRSLTELQAFKLAEGQETNMFEGPRPLVKERDACGVGFIANTSEGGKLGLFCLFACWRFVHLLLLFMSGVSTIWYMAVLLLLLLLLFVSVNAQRDG